MDNQQSQKTCLPSCWGDDTRMNMMFSEFRSQTVNPEGWNDKMNFWINMITEYCHQTKSLIITHDDLAEAFQRKGSSPQCLKSVLNHMHGMRVIVRLTEFKRNAQSNGWLNWGLDVFFYYPISWSVSYVTNVLQWNKGDDKYVMVNLIKDLASKVLNRHHESADSEGTDNVVSFEDLEQQCSDICMGTNLQLSLIYLQKLNEVILLVENGQQIVKFKGKDDISVKPISEVDRGCLRLQKAKKLISSEIEKIELDIKSCVEDAKNSMKNGMKAKAMTFMKKKKRLEKLLQKKISSLDNIDCLHDQLQDTCSNKKVLDAYNVGVTAMKTATKDDLNLDKIYSTMADVEEMIDTVSDVQEAISNSVKSGEPDLADFEMELDELISEDKGGSIHTETRKAGIVFEDDEMDICRKLARLPVPYAEVSPIAVKSTPHSGHQSSFTPVSSS